MSLVTRTSTAARNGKKETRVCEENEYIFVYPISTSPSLSLSLSVCASLYHTHTHTHTHTHAKPGMHACMHARTPTHSPIHTHTETHCLSVTRPLSLSPSYSLSRLHVHREVGKVTQGQRDAEVTHIHTHFTHTCM